MEVKEGYKQTEVGAIPEDWRPHKIADHVKFQGGSQPTKNTFVSSQRPGYIRLIQIRDYKTDKYETYIPAHLANRFCDENDIMIGRYGPPIFQILRGIKGAYNVALIKAIPTEDVDKNYAYYYLKQDKLFIFIEKLSQRSSGQTGVDLNELKEYPFPLPPTLAEQTAIATVLSDTDALIQSLDRLIAKKRLIKQGATQDLLTGKKRLPGFSGEWEQKNVGEMAEVGRGRVISHKEISTAIEARYPVYSSQTSNNGVMGYIDTYDFEGEYVTWTTDGVNAGKVFYRSGRFNCTNVCGAIKLKVDNPQFIARLLDTVTSRYVSRNLANPKLMNAPMKQITVFVPPLEEQTAIAAILSDMDAEIEALEEKRDKYKAIKQGMMQVLLTGKVRLIS